MWIQKRVQTLPGSTAAIIKPQMLVWARTTAGYEREDLADRLRVAVERVRRWEEGDDPISVAKLRAFADLCGRPLAAFFLPAPPPEPERPPEYRLASAAGPPRYSPACIRALADARFVRDSAWEAIRTLGEPTAEFGVQLRLDQPVRDAAQAVRARLGVSVEAQLRNDAGRRYGRWRDAAESAGVLVYQFSGVEVSEARGFSLLEDHLPLVAINSQDADTARTFTLFHELVHIALGGGALCAAPPHRSHPSRVERYCNAVAAEALVPGDYLLEHPDVASHADPSIWSESEVDGIARKFGVSASMLAWRLRDLDAMDREVHDALQARLSQRRAKLSEGGPNHYVKMLSRLGRSYVRLILNAYYRHAITASEASGLLQVKVEGFSTMEDLAFR